MVDPSWLAHQPFFLSEVLIRCSLAICFADFADDLVRSAIAYCVEKLGSYTKRQGKIGNSTVQNGPYAAIAGRASNLASLTSAALFFFLPVFFLGIGQNTGAFSRFWFVDADERTEYWIVVKRMIVWFVSVGGSWLVLSAFVST